MKKSLVKDFFKANWKTIALTAILVPPVTKLFLISPTFCCGIATIPITNFINRCYRLTPILSRLLGIVVFTALVILSWYAAELVVLLASVAIATELLLFFDIMEKKLKKTKNFIIAASVIKKAHLQESLVV